MDSGLTLKPSAGVTRTGNSRTAPSIAATELAPGKAVTPASDTVPAPPRYDTHERDFVLDPQNREVIFRAIDERSRRVVRQVPEVAARRLKAYTRTAKGRANPDDPHADIEV